MIIECNKCQSLFRLDEGLLREEGSKVRCSMCKHVFVAFPPGWEPEEEKKPLPTDKSLGETVTLESPPLLEEQEKEPLLEDVTDEDFEGAFEEEPETKRIQAISPDQMLEEEEGEEFPLEMDFEPQEEITSKPKPETSKPVAAKGRKAEQKHAVPPRVERPAKPVRPKGRKTGRSKLPLIVLVILILLLGGAGAIIFLAPDLIPDQLAFLKGFQKQEARDPGVLRLRFTAVTGSFVTNSKAGQLFVIRGAISNNYPGSRSYILVKGSILDDKGKVVKTKVAYAGNVFTDSELSDLPMDQINQGLRNRSGKGNIDANIKPQASVPFMIVFEQLPENLSEFTVEPVSSSPGQ
jgi:predicted Zn finger-like uncharacterized protein